MAKALCIQASVNCGLWSDLAAAVVCSCLNGRRQAHIQVRSSLAVSVLCSHVLTLDPAVAQLAEATNLCNNADSFLYALCALQFWCLLNPGWGVTCLSQCLQGWTSCGVLCWIIQIRLCCCTQISARLQIF